MDLLFRFLTCCHLGNPGLMDYFGILLKWLKMANGRFSVHRGQVKCDSDLFSMFELVLLLSCFCPVCMPKHFPQIFRAMYGRFMGNWWALVIAFWPNSFFPENHHGKKRKKMIKIFRLTSTAAGQLSWPPFLSASGYWSLCSAFLYTPRNFSTGFIQHGWTPFWKP